MLRLGGWGCLTTSRGHPTSDLIKDAGWGGVLFWPFTLCSQEQGVVLQRDQQVPLPHGSRRWGTTRG